MRLEIHPSVCLMHKMSMFMCLLRELTLQRNVHLWHCKRGFSEALRSHWENRYVYLFSSVPSCLYTDHGIPCELMFRTLTWKGEWHNSVLFGHQSQRALSPFSWRGKGLLLNPYLSAHNSKWRENSQYYVSHSRLIHLVECNEQNASHIVRKGDKKGRKHGRFCTTRQAGVIHYHLGGHLEFQMLDLVLTYWTPSINSYIITLMCKSGMTGKLVTLW